MSDFTIDALLRAKQAADAIGGERPPQAIALNYGDIGRLKQAFPESAPIDTSPGYRLSGIRIVPAAWMPPDMVLIAREEDVLAAMNRRMEELLPERSVITLKNSEAT